jgi:hypothetical protein
MLFFSLGFFAGATALRQCEGTFLIAEINWFLTTLHANARKVVISLGGLGGHGPNSTNKHEPQGSPSITSWLDLRSSGDIFASLPAA